MHPCPKLIAGEKLNRILNKGAGIRRDETGFAVQDPFGKRTDTAGDERYARSCGFRRSQAKRFICHAGDEHHARMTQLLSERSPAHATADYDAGFPAASRRSLDLFGLRAKNMKLG
jgi:hypothetical protein